jgi:hypothetical protein
VIILLMLTLAGGSLVRSLRAAPLPSGEYQVKAVFLFNFVQFVEWPASAHASSSSPIVIGIAGEDPFRGVLDDTVRGEKVNGRALEVRRLAGNQDWAGCHLLFIGRSEKERAVELVRELQGQPVLCVGEMEGFAERGGVVNFFMADRKVRFEVNPRAAAQQGLKISSRLLQLGRVVEPVGTRR